MKIQNLCQNEIYEYWGLHKNDEGVGTIVSDITHFICSAKKTLQKKLAALKPVLFFWIIKPETLLIYRKNLELCFKNKNRRTYYNQRRTSFLYSSQVGPNLLLSIFSSSLINIISTSIKKVKTTE